LDEAYTLQGYYYYEKGLPEQAIKEFDNALKINPNSWEAYYGKGNLYSNDDNLRSIENFQKAASLNHGSELPGILRDIASAYNIAGFTEKAKYYNLDALKLDGDSVGYFRNIGVFEGDLDNFKESLEFLERSYNIDTANIWTLYYLGQACIYNNQTERSLKYFKKFVARREVLGMEWAGQINHRVGYAYWKNGYKKEAEYYFNKQLDDCNNLIKSGRPWSQLYYTYYDLAGVYAFMGNKEKAYENLRIFNQRQIIPLWMLTLIKDDPLFNDIKSEPEFQQIVRDVEAKYQAEHERVRKWMEEQGTL
jgi:tetratricopeptide (TPR) repeat protein